MRTLNSLGIFIVLIVGVTFAGKLNLHLKYFFWWIHKTFFFLLKVQPACSTCQLATCRNNCIANGATGGLCQLQRNGARTCICSYNPVPCDVDTCRDDCITIFGATDGICQTERNGDIKCMCSYNPVPVLCDQNACSGDCISTHGATGGICQVERNGERKCICSYNPV